MFLWPKYLFKGWSSLKCSLPTNTTANHRYYTSRVFRYPLEENVRENEAEDSRCLALVEETLQAQKFSGNPCVGVIVEPIQSEGGDFHGSNRWFQVGCLIYGCVQWKCKEIDSGVVVSVIDKRRSLSMSGAGSPSSIFRNGQLQY